MAQDVMQVDEERAWLKARLSELSKMEEEKSCQTAESKPKTLYDQLYDIVTLVGYINVDLGLPTPDYAVPPIQDGNINSDIESCIGVVNFIRAQLLEVHEVTAELRPKIF